MLQIKPLKQLCPIHIYKVFNNNLYGNILAVLSEERMKIENHIINSKQ